MPTLNEISAVLKPVVIENGPIKSLDAAESLSSFLVLGGVKALGEATVSEVGRYIAERVSVDLSSQNLTNITKRLEKDELIKRTAGSGRRGDPKTYKLAVEGDTDLKNAVSVFLVLLDFGIDSILRRNNSPENGCHTKHGADGKVTQLARAGESSIASPHQSSKQYGGARSAAKTMEGANL